jgi:hypothetical protein
MYSSIAAETEVGVVELRISRAVTGLYNYVLSSISITLSRLDLSFSPISELMSYWTKATTPTESPLQLLTEASLEETDLNRLDYLSCSLLYFEELLKHRWWKINL